MDTFKKLIGKGPNAILVEEATSDMLIHPDWGKNMEVCDAVNGKLETAKEVVKAIRRRTNHSNPKVQYLALVLLESVMKNGGRRFCRELAACKDLRDDLIKIALRTGKSDVLIARDQAKKILANLQVFRQAQEPHVKSLVLWQRVAEEKGVDLEGIEIEDWTACVVGSTIASDPRNYQDQPPQPAEGPIQQQQQRAPPPAPQGQPQQAPTIQPMVVVGADGQHWLLQLIPPGQRVRGAVQAPPEVQQNVQLPPVANLLHYFAPPPQPRQQQQQQQQVPQHADPRDYGVNQRRNETPEQEEARLTQELGGVQESIELMREMLTAAGAENRSPEEISSDEIITVLAEQLRSYQGRVSYVLSTTGGGGLMESLLKWNDELVAVMESYAAVSGQVGIPVDNTGLVPGTASADGSPTPAGAEAVQGESPPAARDVPEVEAAPVQEEEIFAVFDGTQPDPVEQPAPAAATLDDLFGAAPVSAPPAAPAADVPPPAPIGADEDNVVLQALPVEASPAPPQEQTPPAQPNPVSAAAAGQQPSQDEDFDFEQFLNNRLQPVS